MINKPIDKHNTSTITGLSKKGNKDQQYEVYVEGGFISGMNVRPFKGVEGVALFLNLLSPDEVLQGRDQLQ